MPLPTMLMAAFCGFFVSGDALAQAVSKLPACPSDTKVRWDNCQGTYRSEKGNVYVGEFRDNKRNGQGSLTYPDGTKYIGRFVDDHFDGEGTYIYSTGTKYVGSFKNDKFNGTGFITYKDGNTYEGEFKDDVREGRGTFKFTTGTVYVGELKNGDFNGRGTMVESRGNKYVGEFKDDRYNGTGTYTFTNGEVYVGDFKSGKFSGRGTLSGPDGKVLKVGIWADDKLVKPDPPVAVVAPPVSAVAALPPQTTLPASVASASGRRVALVIGNSAYQSVGTLSNPANDAKAVAAALTSAGFQSVTVKTDLTREGLVSALREFATVADTADWAVVYYSGHGIEFSGVNYMVPVDARLKADRDIDLEAVDLGKVLSAIDGAKALHLVILDACRDNPFLSSMRKTVATKGVGTRGLARVEPDAGTLVIYAAKAGEVALDGSDTNSPFAKALTKRLLTPNLEVRRLFDFVRDDVMEATNRKQQPFSYGSLPAKQDFFFVSR